MAAAACPLCTSVSRRSVLSLALCCSPEQQGCSVLEASFVLQSEPALLLQLPPSSTRSKSHQALRSGLASPIRPCAIRSWEVPLPSLFTAVFLTRLLSCQISSFCQDSGSFLLPAGSALGSGPNRLGFNSAQAAPTHVTTGLAEGLLSELNHYQLSAPIGPCAPARSRTPRGPVLIHAL